MIRVPMGRRDPHAHVIRAPGKRLLRATPLKFVLNKATGTGRRPASANLNLVSFIDFLVVTVIFLLMSFSASAGCPERHVDIPSAGNGVDLIDSPIVTMSGSQVLVDGALAGSTRSIEELGRMDRIPELFDLLRKKRELYLALEPSKPFPGSCLLQIDKEVPALVVKSVFKTAALAGYPNVSFLVQKAPSASD